MNDFWQIFRFVIAALLTLAGVFCMISIILNNFHQIFHRCKGQRTQSVLPAKRFQVYPFVTFNSYQIVITFFVITNK